VKRIFALSVLILMLAQSTAQACCLFNFGKKTEKKVETSGERQNGQ